MESTESVASDRSCHAGLARLARGMSVIAVACWLASLAGCGGSPYELAPVRGSVARGNQPLTAGKIMFAPTAKQNSTDAGKAAVGLIQPDGSYQLTTFNEGDGAIVGEHWVTIFVPESSTPLAAGGEPTPEYKRVAVPKKQVVAAGQENQIDIRL